jgi:hypothetical protein
MRYLVLSDIHANLEALEACLADAAGYGYDLVLVLGDVVGYGPDPNDVVTRIRDLDPFAVVRGNHDKVASGLESADGFNVIARAAARWTFEALTAENRAWVAALPAGPVEVDGLIEICHGSPFDEETSPQPNRRRSPPRPVSSPAASRSIMQRPACFMGRRC